MFLQFYFGLVFDEYLAVERDVKYLAVLGRILIKN
jgi:hypothetical protein